MPRTKSKTASHPRRGEIWIPKETNDLMKLMKKKSPNYEKFANSIERTLWGVQCKIIRLCRKNNLNEYDCLDAHLIEEYVEKYDTPSNKQTSGNTYNNCTIINYYK